MRLDRIAPEPSQGKGWARLIFKETASINDLKTMAIIRPRHVEPYLGKHGWQISESRLPLRLEQISETDFSMLLGPATVQHLEVASNYEFVFFDEKLQRIASSIVRWYGISYRAAKGEISPIEIISLDTEAAELPTSPPHSAPLVATEGWGLPFAGEPTNAAAPFLPVGLPPSNQDSLILPTLQATTSSVSREGRRVKCLNPRCKSEIFDSMKICPFCATPLALASSVCSTLKIEPAALLEQLPGLAAPRLVNSDQNRLHAYSAPSSNYRPSLWASLSRPALIGGALLLVAAALVVFLLSSPLNFLKSGPAPATPALPAASGPETAKGPTTGLVVFSPTAASWVEVTDAQGIVLLRRMLAAGEVAGASGALPLSAVVGRADVTRVQVRGQTLDLAPIARDNVARFEVK
jgi:hypothetical protein